MSPSPLSNQPLGPAPGPAPDRRRRRALGLETDAIATANELRLHEALEHGAQRHLPIHRLPDQHQPPAPGNALDKQDVRNFDHIWFWRTVLPHRKGQPCRVAARGRMNSVEVEFPDGAKVITHRYAVRKC